MLPLARFRVADQSMEPALHAGDYVLVSRWAYRHREPATGDIVVLRNPEVPGEFLIKRIASAGTSGGYFVLGDNASRSRDSRHFGPVPRTLIVGKVRLRAKA